MGSFDGAWLFELLFYLHTINFIKITSKDYMGLYRDDDIIILKNKNSQQTGEITKKIIKTLKIPN